MNGTIKTKSGWRTLRRILVALAVLATLVAIFYTEENWRGKRAWAKTKSELEAKGVVLDWNACIPPPVPDEQNFFKASKMQEWFVGRGGSDLSKRLQSKNADLTSSVGAATNLIATTETARTYLAWSDQFKPDFDLINQALKRPDARMDGDYSVPYQIPIPNFIAVRALAQVLAQRARCHMLVGEPEMALDDLTFLNDSRRMLEGAPTHEPMTLVAAMINVAVVGLYANTVSNCLEYGLWKEPELAALQKQCEEINVLPIVTSSFHREQVATAFTVETTPPAKLADLFSGTSFPSNGKPSLAGRLRLLKNPLYVFLKFGPRGWVYQNMVTGTELSQKEFDCVDVSNQTISPRVLKDAGDEMARKFRRWSPDSFIVSIAVPNFIKAWQTTAHNQTLAEQLEIACALERYRLAHGEYPETLDALIPQFIAKLPHDIIDGQPLHYRRTNDREFLLYSVGWNEKDDGGVPGTLSDPSQGDWVWQYPGK